MASGPLTRSLPPPPPPTPQPVSADHPRCPRCNSQDTKFCYYNNYNLAQPRHFCKSCRRYWTLGGSLRNIPIGGTSRRNTSSASSYSHNTPKRRRYSGSTSSSPTSTLVTEHNAKPTPDVGQTNPITSSYDPDMARTFGALLMEPLPTGFLAIGDALAPGPSYGLRLGHGIEGVGFGQLGRTLWPFFGEELDQSGGGGGAVATSGNGFCGDTWPVSNGGGDDITGVGVDNDGCFAWPDLAISITPGKRMG